MLRPSSKSGKRSICIGGAPVKLALSVYFEFLQGDIDTLSVSEIDSLIEHGVLLPTQNPLLKQILEFLNEKRMEILHGQNISYTR